MPLNRTALFSRKTAGGIFTIVDASRIPNNVFWVCSVTGTDGAGYGRNPDAPFATLTYAIAAATTPATASKVDTIFVMPGHAETWSTAALSAVCATIGIKIVGLGYGPLRPTFTYTHVDATFTFTYQTHLENVILVANLDNIVTGITVAATASGSTLKNVEMRDTTSIKEFLIAVSIAAACTDFEIDGFKFCGLAGGMSSCIIALGAANRFKLRNARIICDASGAAVALSAAASVDIELFDIELVQIDTSAGLGIVCNAATTGEADRINVYNLKDTVVGVSGAAMAWGQKVLYSNAITASPRLAIAVDA